MFYRCSTLISETPRFGTKFIQATLSMNEFTFSVVMGVIFWFCLDYFRGFLFASFLPPVIVPFVPPALGLVTSVFLMAFFMMLNKGKPGSYLWDFGARLGIAGRGPGCIEIDRRYFADPHPFIGASGIWGGARSHVGPTKREHHYCPPSRLGGRYRNVVPAVVYHASLCEIFGGVSGAGDHGAAS